MITFQAIIQQEKAVLCFFDYKELLYLFRDSIILRNPVSENMIYFIPQWLYNDHFSVRPYQVLSLLRWTDNLF